MLVFLQVRDTLYNLKSSSLVSKHGHLYIQRQSSSNINSQATHCARATRILYTNRQFTRVLYVNTLYTFFLISGILYICQRKSGIRATYIMAYLGSASPSVIGAREKYTEWESAMD